MHVWWVSMYGSTGPAAVLQQQLKGMRSDVYAESCSPVSFPVFPPRALRERRAWLVVSLLPPEHSPPESCTVKLAAGPEFQGAVHRIMERCGARCEEVGATTRQDSATGTERPLVGPWRIRAH